MLSYHDLNIAQNNHNNCLCRIINQLECLLFQAFEMLMLTVACKMALGKYWKQHVVLNMCSLNAVV